MSAGELNSMPVPGDDSSLSDLQHLEMCATLTPTTNDPLLVEEGLRTFVVDLTLIHGAFGKSRNENCKSIPAGVDDHSPPTPCELPEKTGLPLLSADSVSAELLPTTDGGDSASLDTPIDPPGLPRPVDDPVLEADQQLLPPAQKGDEVFTTMASQQPTRSATPTPERVRDEFSLSGLATLQTFIPDELLPDDLLVHDADNITNLCSGRSQPQLDAPVRYVRIFPKLKTSCQGRTSQESAFASRSPDHPVRTAHLYLKDDNRLGTGSHSTVYSAPLRLQLDAESGEESTVRVAAKTACAECGAHETLHLEAIVYNAFPRRLMGDQYPAETASKAKSGQSDAAAHSDTESAPQADTAAAASKEASPDLGTTCTIRLRTPEPSPAVVPKFYGYYAAVDADGCVIEHSHSNFSCGPDNVCSVSWPTRILLMEECGKPIVPENYTIEQRADCLELVKHLHAAGFVQNSMYVRNVLVQPGPLSAPSGARSDATPSFRIIDFGRGEAFSHLPPGCQAYIAARASCNEEEWKAKNRVLGL